MRLRRSVALFIGLSPVAAVNVLITNSAKAMGRAVSVLAYVGALFGNRYGVEHDRMSPIKGAHLPSASPAVRR